MLVAPNGPDPVARQIVQTDGIALQILLKRVKGERAAQRL